ncbi:tetratricopeptide repeat protein [Streptomyces sp. NPDC091212]|uniref:tetratricopeptide repeat protein n=1 Tax=Streptomyces sp. NPDC091212 TaxID=3155191 RepID=UPI0034275041
MDPVTVPELAAALHRADEAAWRALAELFPGEFPSVRVTGDASALTALAERLAADAVARPGLLAALRRWLTAEPVTEPTTEPVTEPMAEPTTEPTTEPTVNTIAGDTRISGPAVQARDIHGGIHVHEHVQRSARPTVPRQLITGAAHFTDRTADLAALDALRAARSGAGPLTVVVTGTAGVGKTALTIRWLRGLTGEYPDGQLYADLRGHAKDGPVQPGAVLGQFLRAFGLDHVPADLAEQAALWRTVTAELRIAVMLDNALSAAQVRPLLPAAPAALVAVTSRRRLPGLGVDGAVFHRLHALDPGASVELLSRRLGGERVAREHEAASSLADLCAGLPLAVCVVAARMAARPLQPLAALVGAMNREGGRLTALHVGGGEEAVETALDESYEALPPASVGGYRRLGLLPVAEFGADVTAAACACTPEAAERLLDELVEASLLEELGADRYRFHDLVSLHAARRADEEEPPGVREETVRRVLDWYLSTATAARALLSPSHRRLHRDYVHAPPGPPPFGDSTTALGWLDAERLRLMAAVRTAVEWGWDATAWQLVDSMQPLFLRLRPYDLWIEAHAMGLAAADRAGDARAVSRMLTTGGSGLYNAGRYDEAIDWFGRALRDARTEGDRRAEAQALHGLGQSHRLAGRLEQATSLFTEALTLREEIGYDRGVALTRLCLGDIALASGSPHTAVALLSRAREGLLAVPDPYDAARALAFLGRAHAADGIGDFATAERQLRQAHGEFVATGSVHWQGRVLEMLGRTAQDRGDRRKARDCYEQSLARYSPVSPVDAARLRERLRALGHRDPLGNPPENPLGNPPGDPLGDC